MKRRTLSLIFIIAAIALPGFAQDRFSNEKIGMIQRTLQLSGSETASLEVDNVQGAIHVSGYDGKTIEVSAKQTIRGKTTRDIALAEQEVRVDITQAGNNVRIYVDGPFRGRGGRSSRRDYEVVVNFDVQVPWVTKLSLKTVNAGTILVENTTGDFELGNVNGDVEVTRIAGSGRVSTVNGSVRVSFAGNPRSNTSFSTINGGIDVNFRRNLAGELRFSTINGSVDTQLDQAPTTTNTSGRILQSRVIQIGSGGPELKFSTINGSIRVRSAN